MDEDIDKLNPAQDTGGWGDCNNYCIVASRGNNNWTSGICDTYFSGQYCACFKWKLYVLWDIDRYYGMKLKCKDLEHSIKITMKRW